MKRCVLAMTLVLGGVAAAQQDPDWSKIEVKVVPVAGGVSMLVGQGGNIGVTSGKDGIFLIDDQFEPLLPKIRPAVKTLEQVIAAKPTAQWDATWGKGFMGPEVFVSFVYRSLTEPRPAGSR